MIVDDSGVFRGFWGRLLSGCDDVDIVTTAIHGKAAIEAMAFHKVDLVLLDVEMPEMNGLETIPHLFAINPHIKIIMASGLTTSASRVTVDALARGAHDFITKPSTLAPGNGTEDIQRELLKKIRALGASSSNTLPLSTTPTAPLTWPGQFGPG